MRRSTSLRSLLRRDWLMRDDRPEAGLISPSPHKPSPWVQHVVLVVPPYRLLRKLAVVKLRGAEVSERRPQSPDSAAISVPSGRYCLHFICAVDLQAYQ